jgi:hypothetical protein
MCLMGGYDVGFYLRKDGILHSHRGEDQNLIFGYSNLTAICGPIV